MNKSIFNFINFTIIFCSFTLFTFFIEPGHANDDLYDSKRRFPSVTLQLKWKHQFQFAGYYAALEKGFYRKAGLDVRILEIKDGEQSTDKVIEGKADFGIAMSDLILHRAKGQPVVALAAIFQHSPLIILAPKSSGIENIHALKGKRLGIEAHSAELMAYIENEGISLETFEIVPHGYNVSNLIMGKVEAMSAYSTDEPFILLDQGIGYSTFTPRAGGIDFYGDTLFTSETLIREHPERVASFLAATLKGWKYALENSEEIIDLILSQYTQRHSREHLLFEAHRSKSLIMADVVQLGHMHIGRWDQIAKTYAKFGMIDKKISLDGFLYSPNLGADYGWLKRIDGILVIICLLLGLGVLVLVSFNRKFAGEIDERKRAQKALQESKELLIKNESLFRGLYDNMTSGSAIYEVINDGSTGSDFIVKSFNQKSLEIEGKTLDQVVGKSLFDLRPTIEDYGLIPVLKKVWETGKPAYFPIKIYQDEIFSNYYENYIFKIPTNEVVTIYNDVTEQKNAEKALMKSEERFALAMEFANDGLFDWNIETNKIYYSPAWKRMIGYENDELPNDFAVWETLTNPEDLKRSWKILNELINKERDKFEIEFRMKHKDGHWVDILSRANAIFNKNNKAVRIVGTHVDISERKKLENQLIQSQKLESIGKLAGGVAHEFNNILSIIVGNNELVMAELPELSLAKESTEEIRIAGMRAKDVVKQLLTFSRQDSSVKEVIDLRSVVQESMKLIRSSIQKNIEILQTLSDDVCPVLGNETQINQLLINLCSNAVDVMPTAKALLTIELLSETVDEKHAKHRSNVRPGQYFKLQVSDNGIGMDKETIDRIFEPYYTTKEIGKGSGIGLAVVHGIVKKHGGSIIADSHPGQGSIFTILFPAYEGPLKDKKEEDVILPTGDETILYVDDEPSIAKLGKHHLQSLGYTAESTTDPLEALEMVKTDKDKFDLVISDMAMPNMTGEQLIAEILKIRPDMQVIICTGYSAKVSEKEAAKIGVSAFAMKPLGKVDLAKTIRKVLDARKGFS